MSMAGRISALALAALAGCAATQWPDHVVPRVATIDVFQSPQRPRVELTTLQPGDEAFAILKASVVPLSNDERRRRDLEDLAMAPVAAGWCLMAFGCVGMPVVMAIDDALVRRYVPRVVQTMASITQGRDNPFGASLGRRLDAEWHESAVAADDLVLRLTIVPTVFGFDATKACVESTTRIVVERDGEIVYEDYLRITKRAPSLDAPYYARCDRYDALRESEGALLRRTLDGYASDLVTVLKRRLPGLPWQ